MKSFTKCTLLVTLIMCFSVTLASTASAWVPVDRTFFPDVSFLQYVSRNIDKNHDGKLTIAEIYSVKSLNLKNKGIFDLTGIKHFTKLESLTLSNSKPKYIGGNVINTLDLSYMKSLKYLEADYISLKSLNVYRCDSLIKISCKGNQLTSLNLSYMTSLEELYCEDNSLSGQLNLHTNTRLKTINCNNNQITMLDIGGTALQELRCENNLITKIQLNTSAGPRKLYCKGNRLPQLDFANGRSAYISGWRNLKYLIVGTESEGIQETGPLSAVSTSETINRKLYKYKININSLLRGNDSKRYVTSVKGCRRGAKDEKGIYDKNTGIVKFQYLPEYIIYYYDIGPKEMPVKVIINSPVSSWYTFYYSPANVGALNFSSSLYLARLKAVGENVLSTGSERDEGIVYVKAGDLVFKLENYAPNGSEKVYINDEQLDSITLEEDGTFTLPSELVQDGISVQVKSNVGASEVVNINLND